MVAVPLKLALGTKRSLLEALEPSRKDALGETAGRANQLAPPSVEYCQVPLPVFDVIAMPFKALASTSAQAADVRMLLTVVPEDVVSSLVPVSVTVALLVIVGASLPAVTLTSTTSVALENAVVPPLVVTSTLVPCVPLVWSQAWKVMDGGGAVIGRRDETAGSGVGGAAERNSC